MKTCSIVARFAGAILFSAGCTSSVADEVESSEAYLSSASALIAEGYVARGREFYRVQADALPGHVTMVCVEPSAPQGHACYYINGGNQIVDRKVYADRFEHPDGRIAFVSEDQIIGPVKRGRYTIAGGWLSSYACKVGEKPYFAAYDVDVTDFHAWGETVVARVSGPADQFTSTYDEALGDVAFAKGHATIRPAHSAPTQSKSATLSIELDATGGVSRLAINDTVQFGRNVGPRDTVSFLPTPNACSEITCFGGPIVREVPEGAIRSAGGIPVDCHGPFGVKRSKYSLPKWDPVTKTCDPTTTLIVEIASVVDCQKFVQPTCDYSWTRANIVLSGGALAAPKPFVLEKKNLSTDDDRLWAEDIMDRVSLRTSRENLPIWLSYRDWPGTNATTIYGDATASTVAGCEPEIVP